MTLGFGGGGLLHAADPDGDDRGAQPRLRPNGPCQGRRRSVRSSGGTRSATPRPGPEPVGLDLGFFLGGVVVVERVFSWPGIGKLAVDSIVTADVPLILGTVLFGTLCIVLANLAVDIIQVDHRPAHPADEVTVTFSIVALDRATGDLGVAVQSKFLAVGAVVPWARAGVGAVATQAFANVAYGPDGLALLGRWLDRRRGAATAGRRRRRCATRQVGIVDAAGRAATHTGPECFAWAGGRTGEASRRRATSWPAPAVVDGLADTFLAGGRPFPELLVACLAAADAAGGDRRGRESAALLVVRAGGGYGGGNDRWIDLRVDDHDDPIGELARLARSPAPLFRAAHARRARADRRGDRRPRSGASSSGSGRDRAAVRGRLHADVRGAAAEPGTRPSVGEPRAAPGDWDATWQQALDDWMGVENLEERAAAPGWIDPRVLEFLRAR